jgi:uncharacterized HhH-GPD family protein
MSHARPLPGEVIGYARIRIEAVTSALHFTGDQEANELLAREPLALLIGFALDQQVSVQTAFAGPLKIKQRLGTLDARTIATTDPGRLEQVFREKPAVHRFPGAMAKRVQELAAVVDDEYGGSAEKVWTEAADGADLRQRISSLPGFGEMKIKSLSAVLAKRFDVAAAQEIAPSHPTLGDVDSPEALEDYQAKKKAYKASLRAKPQV